MKECPRCGRKCPEDDQFCKACGTRLPEKKTEETPMPGQAMSEELQYGDSAAFPVGKKRKNGGMVKIGMAAATVAVLALGAKGIMSMLGSGSHGGVVYLSDDQYYVSEGGKDDEPVALPFGEVYDTPATSAAGFSPDGTYVYYLEDYDDYEDSGILRRCAYKKLGKDSSKNEKYCEEIDSNVSSGFFVSEDGVVYTTTGGKLKYFDGKEIHDLANCFSFFWIEGETRIAYEVENEDGNYSLYGVELKNPNEKILLAAQCTSCNGVIDFDHILYTLELNDIGGDYNDDECAVYVTGFGKKPEKIGQGALDIGYAYGDMAYQLEENGTEIKASDLFKESGLYEELEQEIEEELVGTSTYKTLYAYKDGKKFVVSDKVIEGLRVGAGLVYSEAHQMKVPDDARDDRESFLNYVDENFEKMFGDSCVYFYSPIVGKSFQLPYDTCQSIKGLDTKGSFDRNAILTINDTAAILRFVDRMYGTRVEKGVIQPFTDDLDSGVAFNWSMDEESMYYFGNSRRENDIFYYELNAYEKGKSDCIFSKLVGCQANLYEDGCILAYTDYVNEGKYAATFVDHKGKFCDIGVGNSFVRTGDSQFLYLLDGKLYKYENGKSREIASDVDVFWSQDTMKLSRINIEE